MLYLSAWTMADLEAIRPSEPAHGYVSVFALSASQVGRRIARSCEAAGFPGAYSGHSPRVGTAQDLAANGAELPAFMEAGRWESPRCRPDTPAPRPPRGGPSPPTTPGADNHRPGCRLAARSDRPRPGLYRTCPAASPGEPQGSRVQNGTENVLPHGGNLMPVQTGLGQS